MVLLIIASVSESGSFFQKILFAVAAPVLGLVAYVNKQKMLLSLQIVLTISSFSAFFGNIPDIFRYIVLVGAAVVCVGYLIKIKYYQKDPWGIVGSIGLLMIATAFATNAAAYLFLFNLLLGIGGLLVALYSGVQFFYYKIQITVIWCVLNIIFAITPLLTAIRVYGG